MSEQKSRRRARLQIDYGDLLNLEARSKFIQVLPQKPVPGWPPERYIITLTCTGFSGIRGDEQFPIPSDFHQFELYLSRDYPGKEPSLLWLTDIWHPNISHTEPRHVCTNAVQTFYAQKPLSELVLSLGEMVQYRRYHAKIEPPFPLDREVAQWVREVAEPNGWIGPDNPVDPRQLLEPGRIRTNVDGSSAKHDERVDEHPPVDEHVNEPVPVPPPKKRITFGNPRTVADPPPDPAITEPKRRIRIGTARSANSVRAGDTHE